MPDDNLQQELFGVFNDKGGLKTLIIETDDDGVIYAAGVSTNNPQHVIANVGDRKTPVTFKKMSWTLTQHPAIMPQLHFASSAQSQPFVRALKQFRANFPEAGL